MKRHAPPSPEFIQAMQEYDSIVSRYGMDSEQERQQFTKMLKLAPQTLKDEIHAKAKEMGLIPKPSGFSDDGEPLYSVTDIAKHFGMSEAEIMADIDRLDPQHTSLYNGNINRIQ